METVTKQGYEFSGTAMDEDTLANAYYNAREKIEELWAAGVNMVEIELKVHTYDEIVEEL